MRWLASYRTLALLLASCVSITAHPSSTELPDQAKAKQVWQLLDYMAVDYAGAVSRGTVVKDSEYAEMQEFAAEAERQVGELPHGQALNRLKQQASQLRNAVASKAEAASVAEQARGLAAAVLQAYPFPVSPATAPDLRRGAQLFQAQCAMCHGPQGHGDGPLAATLNPRPIALADRDRAAQRSLFALYQIIGGGVKGTAMPSFRAVSDDDRWALAFFVGTLAYSDDVRAAGAKIWQANAEARQAITGLDALTQTSERALAARLGDEKAAEVIAFLRSNPQALASARAGSTSIAKAKLSESLAALERGDRAAATKLALSAYLDGFEPVEPALAARNRALFEKIESAMTAYRAHVASSSVEDVRAAEQSLQALLDEADAALAPGHADAAATFIGALTILLREGLEALLVVVAIVAFLKKAERRETLVYVHSGWIAALAAGGVTWGIATYLVDVSGASRELTEGFSSLFAAVVLLSVGIWMHQKSVAGRWQVFLKQKMSAALSHRTAWFLFSLAFVAVYREVFETVLFYAALWTEGNGWPLLAGLGAGASILGIIAVLLLRTSARLPIGKFFAASSALVAILAVVLAGKGIAALQEAGWLHTSPAPIPRIDVLGIYPSMQTLLAQTAVLFVVVMAFVINTRSGPMASVAKDA
ncbi:MAG: cytochrome c/FTR1 family iron permease [Betaproteobacteria bacterium]|nr:cytochrome c/FTR1 family iron permease [Betaproteobacteria bacterium]